MPKLALDFYFGRAGWVRVIYGVDSAYLKFERKRRKWEPIRVVVERPTASNMRALPINRIVLAVNASDWLERHYDEPEPVPFSAEFYDSFTGFAKREPIRLERPPGRKLDDSFYQQVADAYALADSYGLPPRAAIAEAAGVSPDVAARWIYEARKKERGLIPKTTPGKVTT